MKIVKNYSSFSEEYRLNENLLNNAWGKIIAFFKRNFGKHAWIYYTMYLKRNKKLPSRKVEIICPPTYLSVSDIPTEQEVEEAVGQIQSRSRLEESMETDQTEYVKMPHPDPNMRNVNVKELMEEIETCYFMNLQRANKHQQDDYSETSKFARTKTFAVFIWGAPGIGKTEILHQVAHKLKVAVQEWHLATIEPTDFRGVPKVENDRTVSKLPSIFPTSDGENERGGIMFFDELNRAPEMVLSAALSLALGGKHGQYEIPPRWIIIAAGNRPDDIPGKLQDDPILWNRFFHVNYVPDINEWADWAKQQPEINPDLIEFLNKNNEFYHQMSPDKSNPNWPSPRTWEMASQEEYYEKSEDWENRLSENEVRDIYQDFVGFKAAKKFAAFQTEQDKKRYEERLKRIQNKSFGNNERPGGMKFGPKLDDPSGEEDEVTNVIPAVEPPVKPKRAPRAPRKKI